MNNCSVCGTPIGEGCDHITIEDYSTMTVGEIIQDNVTMQLPAKPPARKKKKAAKAYYKDEDDDYYDDDEKMTMMPEEDDYDPYEDD